MEARIYLKEGAKGKQMLFVATSSEVWNGERFFDGYQSKPDGTWVEWDMLEKDINRKVKNGKMVRLQ